MKSITICAPFVLICQSAGSHKTFECVEKHEGPSVATVAFYAHISHNFKALSAHKPFIFDAVETNFGNGYDRKLAFLPLHPVVYMHFLGPFTPRVYIILVPVVNLEKCRQYCYKMESQKGQSMQIQKNSMMTLRPQFRDFGCIKGGQISNHLYIGWPGSLLQHQKQWDDILFGI